MTPSPRPELPALDSIRHVHLIGVAGTAMGTLACMLAESGLRVTGSDTGAYPPMSDQLAQAEIPVLDGFRPEHVLESRPDLVVIGNAIKRDNPEARATVENGIPYASMPDAIRTFFIADRHSVVIAGTHGKTTTTSLVGWILFHAGRDPGLLVGGVAHNFQRSYRLGKGPHFVIEGDEYDTAYFEKTPKFLHYAPRTVLFTSCEFDHGDIYGSLDEIQSAFRALVERLPADGRLIAATEYPGVASVAAHSSAPVESYGTGTDSHWRSSDVRVEPHATHFGVWCGEDHLGELELPLFGRHNVENAVGATAVCHGLGLSFAEIRAALREFKGIRRRQEVRGEAAGMLVVDDFAHHPTAVRETIGALRARFPEHCIWAIFEPRTNTSRRRTFEEAYVDALEAGDRVIVAQVYRAEQIPEDERMRPELVVQALRERQTDAHLCPSVEDIIDHLVAHRTGRDVALIMSNGDFGGIFERLLARLRDVPKESS